MYVKIRNWVREERGMHTSSASTTLPPPDPPLAWHKATHSLDESFKFMWLNTGNENLVCNIWYLISFGMMEFCGTLALTQIHQGKVQTKPQQKNTLMLEFTLGCQTSKNN